MEKPCETCGRNMVKQKNQSKRYWQERKFCSWKCRGIDRSMNFVGERHHNWKGGNSTSRGYVVVNKSDHPNASKNGKIFEHRMIMANHIRRPLLKDEIVHHINGIKTDNRIENLKILSRSEHAKLEALLGNNVNKGKRYWGINS